MEEGEQVADAMERSERNIDKKITKLEYYTEPVDELIESNDYLEMEIAVKPGKQIGDKITVLFHSWKALSWTLEFRFEKFGNGRRTRRTSSLVLYRKGTEFPKCFRRNKDKRRTKSRGRMEGSPGAGGARDTRKTTIREGILGGGVSN